MNTPRRSWLIVAFGLVVHFASGQLPAASFQHLKRDIDLFSSMYCTLTEDQYGFIWFGSRGGGGLYRFDGYTLRSFQTDPTNLSKTLASAIVNDIYGEVKGRLIIGTFFGFSVLDPVTGKFENFNNQYDQMANARISVTQTFLYDAFHDVLWIGTNFGLAKMTPFEGSTFVLVKPDSSTGANIVPEDILRILQDPHQPEVLWLGTSKGLFQYDIDRNIFSPMTDGLEADQPLSIQDMYFDEDGIIWLATNNGQVVGYHPVTLARKVLTIPMSVANPPESREVFKLLPEQGGSVWVATMSSVGLLDLNTGQSQLWAYDESRPDGLMSRGAYRDLMSDRHGRLWIASWRGVQYARQAFMPPSAIRKDIQVAIIDVEAIPLYEQAPKPLMYTEALDLHKDQREITFHYVLPNPLNTSAVKYQYKLDGYDDEWITTDQRTARYTRLKGGRYTFMVRAREREDQAWTNTTALGVSIPKRLTEFWWFWGTVSGILLSMVILVNRMLLSRVKKDERLKAEFEHQLSEIQMQALRAQMNPHFLFNSLNSIKYFAISKSKDETAAYVSKFALLVRAILNNSKARTISLREELEALKLYIEIEHMRLEGKFEYTIDIDSGIHIRQAQIPPMILQPYVENAIWHGLMHKEGKGRLLVQVKDLGQSFQCIIEDNGIGRTRSTEIRKAQADHKKSVGMQITGDRIALINRIYHIDTQVHVIDLTDTEGRASGTRVVIHIPLIHDEEE